MTLSFITDEVSDDLREALAFARLHRVEQVELRTVGGVNLLHMADRQIAEIRSLVESHGLSVSAYASPVLKWACREVAAPDSDAPAPLRLHGFEPGSPGRQGAQMTRACRIAQLLGTRYLRVFTYLRHPAPSASELSSAFSTLAQLAQAHDLVLLVEHEKVCHVGTTAEVDQFLRQYRDDRIQLLLDLGNFAEGGELLQEIPASWLPRIGHVHIKDYSLARATFVPAGEGDVDFSVLWAALARSPQGPSSRSLVLSMETHCPDSGVASTAASLRFMRALTNPAY